MNSCALVTGLAGVSVLLALLVGPSHAYDYQPLQLGSQWFYDNPVYGPHTMSITGEREVLGTMTIIRHQEEEGQIYENYWTSDEAGNLFLHGAYNYEGVGAAYLPPIQVVAAPLYLGGAWVTEDIHVYDLDGTPWGNEPFDYRLRVYTEGIEQVPAGDFYAYGVGTEGGPPAVLARDGQTYDLLGRALSDDYVPAEDSPTDWYSDGIGEVMWGTTYLFVLVSYDLPVPVVPTTWGRIRSLFR